MYCLLSLPLTAQNTKVKSEEVTVKAMTYNTYSGRKMGIDKIADVINKENPDICLLYTSPSPRDLSTSRMPSSA